MDHKPSRFPLHFQILIALVLGTVLGLLFNSGSTKLPDSEVTVTASPDGKIAVAEMRGEVNIDTQNYKDTKSAELALADLKSTFESLQPQTPTTLNVVNRTATFLLKGDGAEVTYIRDYSPKDKPEIRQRVLTTKSFSERNALVETFPELAPSFDAARSGLGQYIVSFAKFLGDIFLRLLKMVTVPLIATSLISGMAGLGQSHSFGKMFGYTLFYYATTSMLAITTGIIMVNIFNPGVGVTLPGGGSAVVQENANTLTSILINLIESMIPTNPIASLANGDFLSIITFSILIGMMIATIGGDLGTRLATFFTDLFEVMMRLTMLIIALAPVGVLGLMLYATATQGLSIFLTLGWYMLTVVCALSIHAFVVLPLIVHFFSRHNPFEYLKALSPALMTAFSTASSNATLPLTMNCVENRAGISNKVSSFVLPLGATINMDGTALYEAVAVLFIAQATPGFEMTLSAQILVAVTALLASVGAAGIPHAGLVMMAIVLQAVGLPMESQGIILAVDRILDMARTTVNVWSDSCGCAVVESISGTAPASPDPEPQSSSSSGILS